MGSVEVELFFECFDAIELALTAQEVGELDSRLLAVQVVLKVEQMGLEE